MQRAELRVEGIRRGNKGDGRPIFSSTAFGPTPPL